MNDLLTPQEIIALTGKQRFKAQQLALSKMGVRYVVRPDGSPVVSRVSVERLLGGKADKTPAPSPEPVLNFAALHPRPRRKPS